MDFMYRVEEGKNGIYSLVLLHSGKIVGTTKLDSSYPPRVSSPLQRLVSDFFLNKRGEYIGRRSFQVLPEDQDFDLSLVDGFVNVEQDRVRLTSIVQHKRGYLILP